MMMAPPCGHGDDDAEVLFNEVWSSTPFRLSHSGGKPFEGIGIGMSPFQMECRSVLAIMVCHMEELFQTEVIKLALQRALWNEGFPSVSGYRCIYADWGSAIHFKIESNVNPLRLPVAQMSGVMKNCYIHYYIQQQSN